MLGSAGAAAEFRLGDGGLLVAVFSVAAAASAIFLALTYCVYRYGRPRRLMPAYLREPAGSQRNVRQ